MLILINLLACLRPFSKLFFESQIGCSYFLNYFHIHSWAYLQPLIYGLFSRSQLGMFTTISRLSVIIGLFCSYVSGLFSQSQLCSCRTIFWNIFTANSWFRHQHVNSDIFDPHFHPSFGLN